MSGDELADGELSGLQGGSRSAARRPGKLQILQAAIYASAAGSVSMPVIDWTRWEHKRQDNVNDSVGREKSALPLGYGKEPIMTCAMFGFPSVAISATGPCLKQRDPMFQCRAQRSGS